MESTSRHRSRSLLEESPEYCVSSQIRDPGESIPNLVSADNMAIAYFSKTMERESTDKIERINIESIPQEDIHRSTECWDIYATSRNEHEGNIQGRDRQPENCRNKSVSEPSVVESPRTNSSTEHESHVYKVSVRGSNLLSGSEPERCGSEARLLQSEDATGSPNMERTNPTSGGRGRKQYCTESELVIRSFNCEGWNDAVMIEMLSVISDKHTKNVVLCCQETWKYKLSAYFMKKVGRNYAVIHEPGMDATMPKGPGRPYGGVCMIISKQLSYKAHYTHKRCLSIILNDFGILLSNVYMPFKDSRISVSENTENYMEAIGHLRASHELAEGISDYITVGDFNYAPSDISERVNLASSFLRDHFYSNTDLQLYDNQHEYSHKSGRLVDRIVTSQHLTSSVDNVFIDKSYVSSDHFPVTAQLRLIRIDSPSPKINKNNHALDWRKASQKSLESYSRLSEKLCRKSLKKFLLNTINGLQLYEETVENLHTAAQSCIPKHKTKYQSHDIPQWRERMTSFKENVDYWLQNQFLQGGPRLCSTFVRQQLRLARARYKRQLRTLRREISVNVADYITERNCHNVLFKNSTHVAPALINGKNRSEQPEMWRSHLKKVFKAEDTPYNGNLLSIIDEKLANNTYFDKFTIDEINTAITYIDTNKSYDRHYHWKYLLSTRHSAKLCLCHLFDFWASDAMSNRCSGIWPLFDTTLSLVPKTGKRDLSLVKSWRPISIGTSENWVLERIFLSRLLPFLGTSDCQFGYKEKHSTSHAIELVRLLERGPDSHVCMLDASSAFDTLSWCRIRDQLPKRRIPFYLVKLCLKQLTSNRISICGTRFLFPRTGIKQGGILSGRYFSICYDDLVHDLRYVGAGTFLHSSRNKRILLFILIYADDIILIARSPYGLSQLIKVTLNFARKYNDLSFNPGKSSILRLGCNSLPAVSVYNIPVTECYEYLGVMIGRAAKPQNTAATTLYTKSNTMLVQNKELFKCSLRIKNRAVVTYGSVYAVETFLSVDSRLRRAHRYLTRAVHNDWRRYADLPGPNIRSRRLYTVYNLDSLEVIHRRRRNNFLIKAEKSDNEIIRTVIGSLPRITV